MFATDPDEGTALSQPDRRGAERARRSRRRDRRQDAIDGTSQAAGPIRRSLTASSGGAVNSSGLAPAPAFVSAALTFEGRLLRTPTAERRLAHGHEAMGATSDSRSRPGNSSPASFRPWVSLVLPYTRRRRARRPRRPAPAGRRPGRPPAWHGHDEPGRGEDIEIALAHSGGSGVVVRARVLPHPIRRYGRERSRCLPRARARRVRAKPVVFQADDQPVRAGAGGERVAGACMGGRARPKGGSSPASCFQADFESLRSLPLLHARAQDAFPRSGSEAACLRM